MTKWHDNPEPFLSCLANWTGNGSTGAVVRLFVRLLSCFSNFSRPFWFVLKWRGRRGDTGAQAGYLVGVSSTQHGTSSLALSHWHSSTVTVLWHHGPHGAPQHFQHCQGKPDHLLLPPAASSFLPHTPSHGTASQAGLVSGIFHSAWYFWGSESFSLLETFR